MCNGCACAALASVHVNVKRLRVSCEARLWRRQGLSKIVFGTAARACAICPASSELNEKLDRGGPSLVKVSRKEALLAGNHDGPGQNGLL